MNLKIHRGTNEIGGTCIEIWTDKTRIILEIGMPLVGRDGGEFEFGKHKHKSKKELISDAILPDIPELYSNNPSRIDGILISHAHQDHYGFNRYVDPQIKYYLGKATHELIKTTCLFTRQTDYIQNFEYIEDLKKFTIGDIYITPYLVDHSAYDAHGFLIEADGKRIFYSGDFRAHGRKGKLFEHFLKNPPRNIDLLLMEGTQVGRSVQSNKTENEIEQELVELFSQTDKANLVYCSGQNIDRLVSIYRACIKTDKLFVVDVYVAYVLTLISKYSPKIPHPSKSRPIVKVIHDRKMNNYLESIGKKSVFYQFGGSLRISHDDFQKNINNAVLIIRPSMLRLLKSLLQKPCQGNFIYSMWKGYLEKTNTRKLAEFLEDYGFDYQYVHTSGHADVESLKKFVAKINPTKIVPIHTFAKETYQKIFTVPILEIDDKEETTVA